VVLRHVGDADEHVGQPGLGIDVVELAHAARVLEDYDAIIDAACTAWKNLIAAPTIITSIGSRNWVHVGQR